MNEITSSFYCPYFIDFDGTITDRDIPWTGKFFSFQKERLALPPNKDIMKICKNNYYYVLTNSLSIEKYYISKYLVKHGIANKCLKVLTTSKIFYINDKRKACDKKAKIIMDFIDFFVPKESYVVPEWYGISLLYVDRDQQIKKLVDKYLEDYYVTYLRMKSMYTLI